MTLLEVISELSQRGVKLWVDNNDLQVRAPKGALTPELRTLLVSHKHEILTKLCRSHTNTIPLVAVPRAGELPLSLEQARLWAAAQLAPDQAAHHLVQAIRLTGSLDVAALQHSLQSIVKRHETLRTSFPIVDDQPIQLIAPALPVTLPMVTIADGVETEAAILKIASEEALQPFDLVEGPLWRFKLIQVQPLAHVLLLVMHHIITDGASMGIFIHELAELYTAFQAGAPSPLSKLSIQYADFASWQRQWLQSEGFKEHQDYWQQQLAHAPALLDLPTDYPRPAIRGSQNTHYFFKLPLALCNQLEQISKESEATLFMTLLAGFKLLLYRYSGQEDILVGSPTSGRIHPEVQPLIGFFAYPIVLRTHLSGDPSFQELLGRVREVTLAAYAHQDVPLSKVMEVAQPQRSTSYNPLFQVLFGFANQSLPAIKGDHLAFSPIDDSLRTSTEFDLFLTLFGIEQGVSGMLEYNPELFAADTITALMDAYQQILVAVAKSPQTRLSEIQLSPALQAQITAARARDQKQTLAITANFTAEPLREALAFWMQELGLPSQIEFAPYNQIFQQLLDPTSLLARNETGVNIVLVRPSDWVRFDPDADGFHQKLEQNAQQLVAALHGAAARTATPYLVCLCPAAPQTADDPAQAHFLQQLEAALVTECRAISGVYVITTTDLAATYPVTQVYDPLTDQEGHIPFTLPFFTALGSQLARTIYALRRPPYKVIVLDCDNTLWQGVCGEDGATGVVLSAPFLALQEFMIQKAAEGYLLCLCSKNSEEDVFQVFAQRADMRLQRHHLVAWRINWQPKSENIKALAKTLDLGLDSFIFLDDNPVECAEVQANCPEVLTLQLPEEASHIPTFLTHLWAFDRLKVTAEDQKRTRFYQQNAQREQLRERAPTLQEFLDNLAINIQIEAMTPAQLPRVAQLTQRTNQFNTTTIRRSESEIQHLCQAEGYTCLVTQVKDRFGDYGLVGVLLFNVTGNTLKIDTFLMSCRVLGLGVEHRLLARVGEIAQARQCQWVEARYKPTRSNQPMRNFLERVGEQFKIPQKDGYTYRFPVDFCQAIRYQSEAPEIDAETGVATNTDQRADSHVISKPHANGALFTRIATELHDPQQILQIIETQQQVRSAQAHPFVAPRDELERLLATHWAKLLRVDKVGIHDNFFALGGDSIQGVIFFNQLQKQLGEMVHIPALFSAPTVAQMAAYLNQQYGPAVAAMLGADASTRPEQPQERVNATHVMRFRQMLPSAPSVAPQGSKNPPAIFVLSPLRSGSTLLRVMLSGHPQLFAPPELHLLSFTTLQERKSAFAGVNRTFLEGTLRAIMEMKGCSLEEATTYMTDAEAQNLTVQQFYARLQADLGERILIDKTPSYALDLDILQRAEAYFANARYIHLRRHPYGSIRSFEKAHFDQFFLMYQHTFSPRQLAELNWLVSHQNILQFLNTVSPERQIAITFEDLVGQPAATMQRLSQFIGVDFTPAMVQPYDNNKSRMTDGIHAVSRMLGDVNFHQHRAIDPTMANSWQAEYKEDFLGEITWEVAATLGYPRAQPEPSNATWSPLVTLQPEGNLPPFFCVHPIGGHALGYLHLAQQLDAERPFIALQAVGLDGQQAPLASIEAMAAAYLKAIQTVQPTGPYYLGGWSFGGMVAFEMAQQLQRAGQEIALLALIDTPVKPMPVPQLALEQQALPADEVMRAYMVRDFSALAHGDHAQPDQERNASQEHFFALFKANYQARLHYNPQRYQGDLVLFYARAQVVDVLAGWSDLVAGDLTTVALPGDHYSIMRAPHVKQLAQQLAQFLNQADVRSV
ncbi:MAG: HAD-IIIC family phosphatase [Caldilineaceae bacterium]